MMRRTIQVAIGLWLASLAGGCADAYDPADPWEGPHDGPVAAAMAADDDPAAPERDSAGPDVEPLSQPGAHRDDAGGSDGTGEPAEIGDAECDDIGFLGESYTHCDADEVFADGCCWPSMSIACDELACDGGCFGITTVPMTVRCEP